MQVGYDRKVAAVTPNDTEPRTPSTSRGEQTRRALLEAARERFARDGYRGTSVADVSRDAGVGGTTAYVHFANKEALFFAAVDDDLEALFADLAGALVARGPDEDLAGHLVTAVLDTVDTHPLAHRLLAGLEPDFTARVLDTEAFGDLRRSVADLIAAGQDEGAIRPDLASAELADGLVAVVVAVAMTSVQIGDAVLHTFGPGVATLFRGVLTPDPRL